MIDVIVDALRFSPRPLLICDVDDVALEFIRPFQEYLASRDHRLHADSFRLHGNIRHVDTGKVLEPDAVTAWIDDFFAGQERWQIPALDAVAVLSDLSKSADVVFLTAMPPRHRETRRRLLDRFGFPYPLIATEEAKGAVALRLTQGRDVPSAFVDDIFVNHHSVRAHVPNCLLINLLINEDFHRLAPDPGQDVHKIRYWRDAATLIRTHFDMKAV